MDLKEVVSLYRRWIWLLAGGLLLGLALGLIVSVVQTRVYEATAKVLVARSRQQSSTDILAISDQQLVATYQQLLKTQAVLDEAGSRLGIKINPDNVKVQVLQNTQIIEITVDDVNADRAASIANTLVKVLIDQNESLQGGRYAAYEDGLNTQVAQVERRIADLQGQINKLDQASIQEQLTQVNEQMTSLQDEILTLEKDIARSPEASSPVARAALAEKQAQISQLRSLLSLYQQIQTNLTFLGQPAQAGTAPSNPQIAGLQSTLQLYQQLYLSLLNNLESVKLARVQSTPTINQIETAAPPTQPIRPQPLLYTALAAMLGLFLTAAAILLIDYFDDSFHTTQKVQELLHAPVIGEVNEMGAVKRRWYDRRIPVGLDAAQKENTFGILRMNLTRLLARKERKAILITSAWRGEGKTTVCANLARSFAQSGKRVILVDADLAHPQIHARFGLENHMGLTDILSGSIDWQEASCTAEKITIITAGPGAPAANGMLESDKMDDLLERIERKADIVIVDGPPLFVLNAQILAAKVGAVVLVVQQGETKTSIAGFVRDQMELQEVSLLGVVMNRVPRTDAYYFEGGPDRLLEPKPDEKVHEPDSA